MDFSKPVRKFFGWRQASSLLLAPALVLALTLQAQGQDRIPVELESLSDTVKKFVETPGKSFLQTRLPEPDPLRQIRGRWISPSRYQAVKKTNVTTWEAPRKAEFYYRLGRHAYLLGFSQEAKNWLGQLPEGPSARVWQAKRDYLQGILLLAQQKSTEAGEAFSRAIVTAKELDENVVAGAKLAIARIAFEEGRYEEARAFYSQVAKNSPYYEEGLEESAWTEVRLNRADLAATNVDLLFSLFPYSRLLPEAGYLLARIRQTEGDPEEGLNMLVKLRGRFAFEEEATKNALTTYRGREEEILYELNPTWGKTPARAVLPPMARTLLLADPIVRRYFAEFEQVDEEEKILAQGLTLVEIVETLLNAPQATTIEQLVLLEKANDIERKILQVPYEKSPPLEKLQDLNRAMGKQFGELNKFIDELVEVDRHLWINWSILRGEREEIALSILRRVREGMVTAHEKRAELKKLALLSDELQIRIRYQNTANLTEKLKGYHKRHPEMAPWLERLADLRKQIEAREQERIVEIKKSIPILRKELKASEARLAQTHERIKRQARRDIRRVLSENQRKLSSILARYQWTVGEARYRVLRATEKKMAEARKRHGEELNALEDRITSVETSIKNSSPIEIPTITGQSPEIAQRSKDVERFSLAARDHAQEIRRRIKERIETDRRRFDNHGRIQDDLFIDEREIQRQEAILAYKRLLGHDDVGARAPYALYRLAQLHHERGESLARLSAEKFPKWDLAAEDYQKSIASLEKIRRGFPKFPYRENALYLLGYVHLKTGEHNPSARAFKQLVAEFPRSPLIPEVQLRLGEHYFSQKKYQQAIPHYQAVLSHGFNYFYDKALYKLAWANYLTGRYDSAIAHFLILLDYNAELTEEQRNQFVEFSDEAVEYLAFSLFRSGGAPTANRIFNRIGWKPYALNIIKRMGEIFTDRGYQNKALASFELAITHFPMAAELPDLLEKRITIYEQKGMFRKTLREKERVARILAPGGPWRQHHQANRAALNKADYLLERATYSVATQYDVASTKSGRSQDRLRAIEMYRSVAKQFPQSKSAYDATYRLAEIDFSQGKYMEAIAGYDATVRNDRFSHRFSDSLYGIVVAREKVIAQEGGLDQKSVKVSQEMNSAVDQLVRSIDNLVQRLPQDERSPKALYRSASVLLQLGRYDEARSKFQALATRYPDHEVSETAIIATIDSYLAEEKWEEASTFASEILVSQPHLSAETQAKITELREGALFKAAGRYEKKNQPEKAVAAYIDFEEKYPQSKLASTALFNAFAVGKRNQLFQDAEIALEKLIEKYPQSPEASHAHFELALISDALLQIDKAKGAYRKAMELGLDPKKMEIATQNLATLIAVSDPAASDALLRLASRLKEKPRAKLELQAANLAEKRKETEQARKIWQTIERRTSAPLLARTIAAAKASQAYWNLDRRSDATYLENLANQRLKRLKGEDRTQALLQLAEAKRAHISADRRRITTMKLQSRSAKSLQRSFEKKAKFLARLEKSVLKVIKLGSVRASASALYDLGIAYRDFILELKEITPPPEQEEAFQQFLTELLTPLEEKAKQALTKSHELLVQERLPETYFTSLATELMAAGVSIAPAELRQVNWADSRLPLPPALVKEMPAVTVSQGGGTRGLLLLAATPSASVTPRKAQEQLERGIKNLQSIWSTQERQEAIETFQQALSLAPGSTAAIFNLAILHAYEGDFKVSQQQAKMLETRIELVEVRKLQTLIALLSQRSGPALASAQEFLKLDPKNENAQRHMVLALLLANRKNKALQQAREFLRHFPQSVLAHRALALTFRLTGQAALSRLLLERARALDPQDPVLLGELGVSLSESHEILLRSKLLQSAAKSGHPESLANWAKLAFEVRQYETACKEWELADQAGGHGHPVITENLRLCQPEGEKAE